SGPWTKSTRSSGEDYGRTSRCFSRGTTGADGMITSSPQPWRYGTGTGHIPATWEANFDTVLAWDASCWARTRETATSPNPPLPREPVEILRGELRPRHT